MPRPSSFPPGARGLLAWCAGLVSVAAHASPACGLLRLIDIHEVPADTRVDGSLFGGISGLDYDSSTKRWYLVSDARSENMPGRLFVANLDIDSDRINSIVPTAARPLRSGPTGTSQSSVPPTGSVDAESIRVDRRHGLLVAGEGDEQRGIGPWLRRFDHAGSLLGEMALPWSAVRPNRSIEGIAFEPRGRVLWIALESPLLADGPPPDVGTGADIRMARVNLRTGEVSQYVYPADAARSHQPGETSDNGVSEILGLGARRLLVLERSGIRTVDGRFRFHTRLYCADFASATNVSAYPSLSGRAYQKAVKRRLIEFDHLRGTVADNLEAMSWGPRLAGRRRSLVLASDNNLFEDVPTQFFLFEVRE